MENKVSFELRKIGHYLKNNNQNTVEFFGPQGKLSVKTFHEVYQDAVATMLRLRTLGIKTGEAVVIMGKNSYCWLVVEVACIFSGFKTIALPETFNAEQINECLGIYKPAAWVAEKELAENLAFWGVPGVLLDFTLFDSGSSCDKQVIEKDIANLSDYRIVVFTSGTSLRIKSFEINAVSTEYMMQSFICMFNLGQQDRWLICHPFSHYSHLEYALGGLCGGYNLIITDVPTALLYFRRLRPSVFISVPAVYYYFYDKIQQMLEEMPEEERSPILKYISNNPFMKRPLLNQKFSKSICRPIHDFFGGNIKFFVIGTAPSRKEVKDFFVQAGLPLYEGYGLTETGMISMNSHNGVRIGSVGRAFPGIKIDIQDDGVIRVKSDVKRVSGYDNFTVEDNLLTFPEENVVVTGDIGYMDSEGFLYVTGRKSEMIITSNGKKINPIGIEEKINQMEEIKQSVVVGHGRPYLVAVLVLEKDMNHIIISSVGKKMAELNSSLAEHEKIKGWILTEEEFTPDNGMMTRNMKLVRYAIESEYNHKIQEFY